MLPTCRTSWDIILCTLTFINSQEKITDNINENQFYIVSLQLSRETYFNFLIELIAKVWLTCEYWRLYKLNQLINLNKKLNIYLKMSTGKN